MIKSVYVFPNGMVVVFNEDGEQIPEYQGEWKKLEKKIRNITNVRITEAKKNDKLKR